MLAGAFDRCIGIDWTGAKGPRLQGLSVACAENRQISLPQEHWTRKGVCDWLVGQSGRALVGIDASFGFPFVDCGAFLPGSDINVHTAPDFWQVVDAACGPNTDFYAAGFVDHYAPWFRRATVGAGAQFTPRLRQCEQIYNAKYLGRSETVFHLVGPSQVGMSSLSVMRMFAQLKGQTGFAIWPFDDMPKIRRAKLVFVELFATQFVRASGAKGKIRTAPFLSAALGHFNHRLCDQEQINDHQADAAMMAAGLPSFAADANLWQPAGLTDQIRISEGWTFGVK